MNMVNKVKIHIKSGTSAKYSNFFSIVGNYVCGPMNCAANQTLACVVTEKSTDDSRLVKIGTCIGRTGTFL